MTKLKWSTWAVVTPWLLAVVFGGVAGLLLLLIFLSGAPAYELGLSEAQLRLRIGENYAEYEYGSGRIIVVPPWETTLDQSEPQALMSIQDLDSVYASWELLICKHGHVVATAIVFERDYVHTADGRYYGMALRAVPEEKLLELTAQ